MDSFQITGGNEINGTIVPKGNKNAALPLIAASILSHEEVKIKNVPIIKDVEIMIQLLENIGSKIHYENKNTLIINNCNLKNIALDSELCRKIRSSILLAGPLLARFGEVRVPPPGGDVIGIRRLDTHFNSFKVLGADISFNNNYYTIKKNKKKLNTEVFLDEPSVTGTENAIMAASILNREISIKNAASEPHIQDLCQMLVKMGVNIRGIGTNSLKILGDNNLQKTEFQVSPDYIEIASLIAMAAVTNGNLTIKPVIIEHLKPIFLQFKRLGINIEYSENSIIINKDQPLEIINDYGSAIPTIADGPWPGFPADLTSIAVVIASFAKGTVLIFEKMFESRMFFVDKLVSMGAKIILCDPHRVVVTGPSKLRAQHLSSPDIRAGMALIIAASAAEGISIIDNAYQIDRGYENIDIRLSEIGLDIKRI